MTDTPEIAAAREVVWRAEDAWRAACDLEWKTYLAMHRAKKSLTAALNTSKEPTP